VRNRPAHSDELDRILYIHPDECIDSGACEPERPGKAVVFARRTSSRPSAASTSNSVTRPQVSAEAVPPLDGRAQRRVVCNAPAPPGWSRASCTEGLRQCVTPPARSLQLTVA
jgi:hypothetical protein